jgi:hypothetical protein
MIGVGEFRPHLRLKVWECQLLITKLHYLFDFGNFWDGLAQAAFNAHSQSHCGTRARAASSLQPQVYDWAFDFYEFDVAAVGYQVGAHFIENCFDVISG